MAEGAPLLREYVGKTCIEGSNPSDSAKTALKKGVFIGESLQASCADRTIEQSRQRRPAEKACCHGLSHGGGAALFVVGGSLSGACRSGSSDDDAPPRLFQVSGATAANLQATVDRFCTHLGVNNRAATAATAARQEVNGDGISPGNLDPFSGSFFNATSPRGDHVLIARVADEGQR